MKQGTAVISPDKRYRYQLTREWTAGPKVVFVMLNPSTADADVDDPTIRRCIGLARGWGFGGLVVVNLFAFRASKPKELKRVIDPVGPDNWKYLEMTCRQATTNRSPVICAWGANGGFKSQDSKFLNRCMEWQVELKALRLTANGDPWHPLYVPNNLQLVSYG